MAKKPAAKRKKKFVRRFYVVPEVAYRIKDGVPPDAVRKENPGIAEHASLKAIDLPPEIDPETSKRTSPMTYGQLLEWFTAHREAGVEFEDLTAKPQATGSRRHSDIAEIKPRQKPKR